MDDYILIRYGELSLKKSNRNQFTQKINASIKRALKEFKELTYEPRGMRFYINLNNTDSSQIIPILEKIPGIHSFSIVSRTTTNIDDICELAYNLMKDELENKDITFKVETNRSDKSYPLTSIQISQEISRYLFKHIKGLHADVHNPGITLNVDLRNEGTFLFTKEIKGIGGMPNGSIGKVMLMVSGGIDSVVAGYLSLKKGMTIEAIHFASPPYTSDQAVQKVIDLLEVLTPFSEFQNINLHIVPFTNIQKAIYDNCREDYGITIMRRMMYRITERLANKLDCLAIVNGENIGQVASQTLESIRTIESVTSYPVIRPLATMDKSEIIEISEKIGTYKISIRPYEDCCTIFVPKHPQIKPLLHHAEQEESKFDFEPLIEEAVNNTKRINLKTNVHKDLFESNDDIF